MRRIGFLLSTKVEATFCSNLSTNAFFSFPSQLLGRPLQWIESNYSMLSDRSCYCLNRTKAPIPSARNFLASQFLLRKKLRSEPKSERAGNKNIVQVVSYLRQAHLKHQFNTGAFHGSNLFVRGIDWQNQQRVLPTAFPCYRSNG